MRQFKTVRKKVIVEITSKEMNISLKFADEIAKAIGSQSEWESLSDLKGSDIERISSGKYSSKLENLMDQAYRDLGYEEKNRKRLGFYSSEKCLVSGSIPRDRKERIFQSFKINVSRESMSIFKSLKNKTLKLNTKIGSIEPKKIEPIAILPDPIKVFPLPDKPYNNSLSGEEKLEKVLSSHLFWSKEWDSKPKRKKSLSSRVERFKDIDDYNLDPENRRIGKPII